MMVRKNSKIVEGLRNAEGKVLVPIVLWALGVPGLLVIILWFFFFRGK